MPMVVRIYWFARLGASLEVSRAFLGLLHVGMAGATEALKLSVKELLLVPVVLLDVVSNRRRGRAVVELFAVPAERFFGKLIGPTFAPGSVLIQVAVLTHGRSAAQPWRT